MGCFGASSFYEAAHRLEQLGQAGEVAGVQLAIQSWHTHAALAHITTEGRPGRFQP